MSDWSVACRNLAGYDERERLKCSFWPKVLPGTELTSDVASEGMKPIRDEKKRLPLRLADQALVAALVAIGLLGMAVYWTAGGGWQERLIDIESAPRRSANYVVDVNRASWPELAQLPGIGETLARRIVESRTTKGPFLDHDDLQRVRGIGPRTVQRIKPYLLPLPRNATLASEHPEGGQS